MADVETTRVRPNIKTLQDAYFRTDNPDKAPLEKLMRAWKTIKELDPADPNSFFMIGGYHGEPFRGAGWGNSQYWGGYCNHGNVLFPPWHRVYLWRLEKALQSVEGCEDVMLPFWDETSDDSIDNGIPHILTDQFFTLDGVPIDNPLRSFKLTRSITDHLSPFPDANYSKPLHYETVRYPLSGLVGPSDIAATDKHNALYSNYDQNVVYLNQNIRNWLGAYIVIDGKPVQTNVKQKFIDCLHTKLYTPFSNTTSAAAYFDDHGVTYVPIESPHNDLHLAVGGYEIPGQGDFSPIEGANGDMGENDTAAMDPIFFFHHCNIDRVFWLWQKAHGMTDRLEIMPGYPGTNTVDNQGPTPGKVPNSWLTVDSSLDPFTLIENGVERPYTTRDCINIVSQLGYDYAPGSLDAEADAIAAERTGPQSLAFSERPAPSRTVTVSGINRTHVRGSFIVSAFAHVGGHKLHLGTHSVLSRWHVDGCANCQTHLMVKAPIALKQIPSAQVPDDAITVEVHTRDGKLPQRQTLATGSRAPSFSFKVH